MKSRPARCPVLLYHSQNVAVNDYGANDHLALASDLSSIHRLGYRIIPLEQLVEWILGERELDVENCVCLTFDDGVDADVIDLDFPGFGLQRSFLNIMRDFVGTGRVTEPPGAHATSFVIASPQAREVMDRHSLFDRGWMSESWWESAASDPMLALGSHGWDHEHPDLEHVGGQPAGHFFGIDDRQKADRQVLAAGEYIASRSGGHWPRLFAYPYGHVSDYLAEEYFPRLGHHRTGAAFTTDPDPVSRDSDRWRLGRFVCGRDWRTESEFESLLTGQS